MELVNSDKTIQTPVALSERQLREAIEKARAAGPAVLADEFLPPPSDPQRLPVLLTILRADVGDGGGRSRHRLADYRSAYPDLDADPNARVAVAAIEAGAVESSDHTPAPVGALRLRSARGPADGWRDRADGLELTPAVAERLGFTDLVQLGKGGFGSVYLAKQPTLGHRCVAIKYTALPSRESQVLAALHHPNIVPVLSVHEYDGARVFCMPYHGRHTLADVLQQIDHTKSLPATGAGFLSTAAPPPEPAVPAAVPPAAPPTGELVLPEDEPWGFYETDRQRLTRLSYVDSVVMGVTRLADALVHAHSRRVIHLDLKPANILITDDGVFMILDFGLADHNGQGPTGPTGGTVRYMAPEQLSQFVHGAVRPDVRMDLYSLGLVFFELLTGRHPFAASMAPDVPMHVRVAARHQPPPPVRAFNPAVPPAVEAIVLKLLQADRAKRYQSAEHVLADLTRHQQNLPLRYAGNPSVVERLAKFRRRHPVAAVALMALALGLIALAAIGTAGEQVKHAVAARAKAETAEAVVTAERLAAEQNAIRIDAGSVERRATRAAAIAHAERWRDEYAIDTDPDWRTRPMVARLAAEQQTDLTLALAEQALLAAHAERLNAAGQKPEVANPALDRAAEWNRRAEAVLADRPPPPVLFEQRAELARLRGEPAPADRPDAADEANLDLYLRGLARLADRKYEDAAAVLEKLIKAEPHHAAGQFALGAVYQTTGRFADAVERYQVAKALAKHDPRPAYNRGALLVSERRSREAVDDLNTALDRAPGMAEAYYQRAIAHLQLGENDAALADVEQAVRLGGASYRYLCLRQNVHCRRNDAAAAARDQRELDATTLQDEYDHVTRGYRAINPTVAPVTARGREAALADFRTATELNPLCVAAWQGLASVQSDLKQTADAIKSLDVLIQLHPGQPRPKFDRAVLLARLRERDKAVRQIAGIPANTTTPFMWYQRACVYALNADTRLDDRAEAYNALKAALQLGFNNFKMIDEDEDLVHVRDLPKFQELIKNRGKAAE